jgi:DNA-binding beta-propeller fold protein YncE
MRKMLYAACGAAWFVAGFTNVALADGDTDRVIDRDAVKHFATLPNGVRFPEGITADPGSGEVYVGTFDFTSPNKLLRFGRHGQLLAQVDFGGAPLLGLEFDRRHDKVYIANLGASKIQRIEAKFDAKTAVEDVAVIPGIGAPVDRNEGNPDGSSDTIIFGSNSFPAPNAMVFDRHGNLYVSDSFQGAIFRIDNAAHCTTPCVPVLVIHHPLLATAGFPPFGANGLALSRDETTLFVANTGDDRVLKLDLASGELKIFAQSVNGADGLARGKGGILWVAANQGDEIVGLNRNGRIVARLGEFKGIRKDGTPEGLLFPASMVIVGDDMFVTNLALPLTDNVQGDEPEEDVKRWTISRIRLPER